MGMLPKGFGIGNIKDPRESVEGCIIATCPTCKREFYMNDLCKICNMCSRGLVWDDKRKIHVYYPGLDESKQKDFGV